ncbi:hypothetical protein CCA_00589 [Chlamydia caviae GPIC]|uniref:Uncharacterized protein n=1 Tax=Chlamydia caviae (strain ATCC VR-813 / DSM 19441 / 03DC25 / GPIC) TaxID=227941 RepID=Q822U0_CHLCV|nr:hypothetical protein CCA_00589 [Chlamydia caviae GPIC]
MASRTYQDKLRLIKNLLVLLFSFYLERNIPKFFFSWIKKP